MAKRSTILVLGASGLTGYKAMQQARKRFSNVYGTYNSRVSPDKSLIKLDLAKEEELSKLFMEIKPDVILNATALHNVDYCESHPDEAFHINSKIVGKAASLCNNIGSRLLHISTDYVFDGLKKMYSETDAPSPLSAYAKSKLEGESQARKCSSFSILRPSVVYGWTPLETQGSNSSSGKPMNFALWALSKLAKGEELKIVNDQYTSPTLADVLSSVALRLAERETNDLYHVAGLACVSRYDFTVKLASIMGYSAEQFVKPIESKSFVQAAKRPTYSCLNCEKIQRDLGLVLPDIEQSLRIMRSQIEIESPALLGN